MVELLRDHKADVNIKDNKGATPSQVAATAGHQDVAEVLLPAKAEVNANAGPEPLHEAAASDHKDVAELAPVVKAKVDSDGKSASPAQTG